jgi:hypothetical protein
MGLQRVGGGRHLAEGQGGGKNLEEESVHEGAAPEQMFS